MSLLSRFLLANRSILMDCLSLAIAMIIGVQLGEARVQSAWNAEKSRVEQVVAKQEQHVQNIKLEQAQINQEISNDYFKKSKLLASHLSDTHFDGMCNNTSTYEGNLSSISADTVATPEASSNALPASSRDERRLSCNKLAEDSAQTTFMLIEFQRWYQMQSNIHQ